MTKAANAVLLYLARYLEKYPARRKVLRALYSRTTGRELHEGHLWKHLKRKVEPSLSATLVYLVFLSRAGELIASRVPGALFTYKHPEWLRK